MPNGKQILLRLLGKYSQEKTPKKELEEVTETVKSGLLLHGSSSHQMWNMTHELAWLERSPDQDGIVKKQGLGLRASDFLLSELFGIITENEKIPAPIKKEFPELSQKAYKAGIHTIWLLIKALEWSESYEEVESEPFDLKETERLLSIYKRKLIEYRKDPEDYS